MATANKGTAGMDVPDMKKHIHLARRAPVHIAFALGGDGRAIVQMDRRMPPRAIERELKQQVADARNHRFGTIAVAEDSPKLARIVINKAGAGMARKLVMALKGTGIRQVELVLEDGSAVESAEAEDELEEEAEEPAEEQETVRPEIPAGEQATRRYRKSRNVWLATRARVDADIQGLSDLIVSMDQDGEFGDELEQTFLRTVDPVLSTLDDSLATYLADAEHATSAEETDRALMQARTTIGLYQQFVAENDTIKLLDENPFRPLAVSRTLNASLIALAAALR